MNVAQAHLEFLAYRTQDNPYLRRAGRDQLEAEQRSALQTLLEGNSDPDPTALAELFGPIELAALPRDVRPTVSPHGYRAGVNSVTAFAKTTRAWWLVSHLWCLEVGRKL